MFDGFTFSDYQAAIRVVLKTIETSENINDVYNKLRLWEHINLEYAEKHFNDSWNNNNKAAFKAYLRNDSLAWVFDMFASELEYYEGLDGYFSFPYTLDFAKYLITTNGYGK